MHLKASYRSSEVIAPATHLYALQEQKAVI